jgi:hypothetical protein
VEAVLAVHEFDDDRTRRRTRIDPHVEDVVGAIAQVAALRVEIADDRRDIGLEEPVSDDQTRERRVHHRQ